MPTRAAWPYGDGIQTRDLRFSSICCNQLSQIGRWKHTSYPFFSINGHKASPLDFPRLSISHMKQEHKSLAHVRQYGWAIS